MQKRAKVGSAHLSPWGIALNTLAALGAAILIMAHASGGSAKIEVICSVSVPSIEENRRVTESLRLR